MKRDHYSLPAPGETKLDEVATHTFRAAADVARIGFAVAQALAWAHLRSRIFLMNSGSRPSHCRGFERSQSAACGLGHSLRFRVGNAGCR